MLNNWTVLFDAVGTLIEPVPDAATTYFQFARQHGSQIPEATIREKFGEARKRVFNSGFAAQECKTGQFNSSDAIGASYGEIWLHTLSRTFAQSNRFLRPCGNTLPIPRAGVSTQMSHHVSINFRSWACASAWLPTSIRGFERLPGC